MPVGRLFLSCISYNVRSHSRVHENLSAIDVIFCFASQEISWLVILAASDTLTEQNPLKCRASGSNCGSWKVDKGTGYMPSRVGLLLSCKYRKEMCRKLKHFVQDKISFFMCVTSVPQAQRSIVTYLKSQNWWMLAKTRILTCTPGFCYKTHHPF